ncbi:DUF3313 family protein [Ferrimonas balearica]|uniref:DUF3313 family protein n=1 Tax=Ferrimonas balearica TaxID=44012 RepID=UPI001C98F05F|nr:DUF3313 family protein [Ferrimonas balearica]MBY5922636.1 DUF3313 domain-containing protein [Ferrimonas balearica]MBY5995620.1 DUF3313 domain-containing protein [Ferrimonas balearica]
MRRALMILSVLCLLLPMAQAKDDFPDRTDDGLTRIPSEQVQAAYWLEGATLAPYTRVAILDCFVAFKKDWQRDYNSGRRELSQRISGKEMEKIQQELAKEFMTVFTRELEERGGYEVVSPEVRDQDVLLLRPAIINLDITAPDLQGTQFQRNYVASAGSMTLYMELYDSETRDLIGRVVDSRSARDTGTFQYANKVTNRAEADRILRRWADLLVKALNEAKP